jgi:hypothetical protein
MAAGNVVLYNHALEDILNGSLDWDSVTVRLSLVSAGYTPNAASHSNFDTQVSSFQVVASGYAEQLLAGKSTARSSGSFVVLDATDSTFSASVVMRAKYAVGRLDNNRPVFYCDLESGSTTGVEATIVIVIWNANGLVKISNPN